MTSLNEITYRSLTKPLPARFNLANVTAQVPSKTCQYCASLVPDRRKAQNGLLKPEYERIDVYPTFPELKASAKAGCSLCYLIRKAIRANWAIRPMEEWGVGPIRENDGLWDELFEAPWDRKVKIQKMRMNLEKVKKSPVMPFHHNTNTDGNEPEEVMIGFSFEFGPATVSVPPDGSGQYGEIGQAISFKVFDSHDIHAPNGETQRRLPSISTLSRTNIQLILNWIRECKSSHPTCHLPETPWLPTRLLDVGPEDGTELPHLVTTQDGIHGTYAALSHMWGNPHLGQMPPLRTVATNYAEMKSGISWRSLSKNFADAVTVTRRLGLRYIWIDSLCIIQDDPLDWQQEAATMQKVYKFAEITIVATSATSAHDGFLERQLLTIPAVKVGYSLDSDPETQEHMILCQQDDNDTGNWSSDIEGSLWNKRGWTMQERSISTRMLHFCKNKLYFECRGCLRSEENEPLERFNPRTFEMWPRGKDQPPTSMETGIYGRWRRAVVEYSARGLTKEFDKLLAIQSIATEMSTSLYDTYISHAGMWKSQLQHELLWQTRPGLASIPDNYRAPSWSWASIDAKMAWEAGSVNHQSSHRAVYGDAFRVLEITEPSSQDQVPFLRVKAFMTPIVFVIECESDERWIWCSRFTFPYDVFVARKPSTFHDLNATPVSLEDRQNAIEQGEVVKFAEGCLDLDNKDDLATSQRSLFYLHIHSARPSGLILEQGTNQNRSFRRVGVATVFTKDSDLFLEPSFIESEPHMGSVCEVNIT